jgi:glycosyltransferase involved in cell wall biosynthesis
MIMKNYKVVIVSKLIPPFYSGAGFSAFKQANFLLTDKKLSHILTQKYYGTDNDDNLPVDPFPEKYVKRISGIFFKRGERLKYKRLLPYIWFNIALFFSTSFHLIKFRKKFDILHCYGLSFLSFYSMLAGRILGKKSILEITLLGSGDPLTVSNKKNLSFSANVQRMQFALADKINNVSEVLMQASLQAGLPGKKLLLITRSVDTSKFHPVSIEEKSELKKELFGNDKTVILFVGALIKRKGFDIAWESFKELSRLSPGNEYFLAILGFDKFNEIDSVLTEAAEMGLKGKIKYFGTVGNIEKFMQASDYLIFPSRSEGSPSTLKEAMACGTVVLSNLIEGITDKIVTNNENGILIKEENWNDYARKVIELNTNPALYSSISEKAVNTIKERYSSEKIQQQYHEAYNEIIN